MSRLRPGRRWIGFGYRLGCAVFTGYRQRGIMSAKSTAPPGQKGRFERFAVEFYAIATRTRHKCTINVP